MAINPLQLPGTVNVPSVDFSGVDKAGDAIYEARQRAAASQILGQALSTPVTDRADVAQRIAALAANPYTAKYAEALSARYVTPAEYTLKPNETRYGGDNQPIASAPQADYTLKPGEQHFSGANQPMAAVPPNLTAENPEGPGGTRFPAAFDPKSGAFTQAPIGPPIPDNIPTDVNAKKALEARGKALISNEQDATKSAEAAANIKPAIDEMLSAYQQAAQIGAIGPIVGSKVGRVVGSVMHSPEEAVRQKYETAKAKVQAMITAAQNKGEGQVSNFERRMYGAQFPDLTASDPKSQLPFLLHLRDLTNGTIEAGKRSPLATQPSVAPLLDRPAIPAPQAAAPRAKMTPQQAATLRQQANDAIAAGADPVAVRKKMIEIGAGQ